MKKYRVLAVLTASYLFLCGCQETNDLSLSSATAEAQETDMIQLTEDTPLTANVRYEKILCPEEIPSKIIPTTDGYACITDTGSLFETTRCVCQYDKNFSNPTETLLEQPAPYDEYYFCQWENNTQATKGGFCSFVCMLNLGNHTPEELDTALDAGTLDWNALEAQAKYDYYICCNATDGSLKDTIRIEGLEDYINDNVSVYDMAVSEKCYYLALDNGSILRVDQNGRITETCAPAFEDENTGYMTSVYFRRDRDGMLMYYQSGQVIGGDGEYHSYRRISEFNENTGTPGAPFYEETEGYVCNCFAGCGEYRILVNVEYDRIDENTGTYREEEQTLGIRDDGTAEVVIDWTASDFPMTDMIPLDDGSFVANYKGFWHLTRLTSSEVVEKQTVTLGVIGSWNADFVRDFNMNHDDLHLDVQDYSISDENSEIDTQASLEELRQDIRKRKAPDLILMDGEHAQFLKLGENGLFDDLYPLMETDTEFDRAQMLPNVLEAIQHPNGSLYALPDEFQVNSVAVKSKYGVPENWTMGDMLSLYEDADDKVYSWRTKEAVLKSFLQGMELTDPHSGTACFDEPDFIRVLEFCNRYPDKTYQPDENDKAATDQWITDVTLRYQRDEDYLRFMTIGGFNEPGSGGSRYAFSKSLLGEDITMTGYPSNSGQGGKITTHSEMGILNTCKDKAAAWEVVKAFINDTETTVTSGYSLMEERFAEQLDNEMYIWNNGKKTNKEFQQNDYYRTYPLTQKERDELEQYLRSCHSYSTLNLALETLVLEEAEIYFSGRCTAEESAKKIQNQVELYLADSKI